MVAPEILDLLVMVRIHAGQPIRKVYKASIGDRTSDVSRSALGGSELTDSRRSHISDVLRLAVAPQQSATLGRNTVGGPGRLENEVDLEVCQFGHSFGSVRRE